ncbi:hypothetical protein [Euzebya tangerina]|uniref:hypothetical protein n=1 Tax=Euzebya tangerina TaxID=591198 RepID=UPI0013C2FD1C|nr:hypothetical protein [Euzebya tangerina]
MIIISLICVVAAAIALGVGYVTEETSVLYASIAAALLGALFLMIAWVQGRRRGKPLRSATVAGDEPGSAATWKGAAWSEGQGQADEVLRRDDTVPASQASPTSTRPAESPAPAASAPAAQSAQEQTIDEAVFKPPAAPAKPSERPSAPTPPPAPAAPPPAPSTGWAPPAPPAAPPKAKPAPGPQGAPPPPPPPPAA